MSNAPDLKALREKRNEILKAELAAWLHDWKKCSDEHIKVVLWQQYNSDRTNFQRFCPGFVPHQAQGLPNSDFANRFFPNVASLSVDLCGTNKNLADLVREGRRGREDTTLPHLIWLLRKGHHSAHIEKEKEDNELEGIQCTYNPFPSSPFGFESDPLSGLTNQMETDGPKIRTRKDIFKTQFLRIGLGDTRRPINEVTLWDWSSIVAALYKSEIARCVITGEKREPTKVKWRLLSIRTDGLGYLLSANSIPDLLVRKELLTDAWNRVQKLLEEEYPLGLEVYRDENGSVFVVPDIDNLLGLTDSDYNNKALREFIIEYFQSGTVKGNPCLAIRGEIVPKFHIDSDPWDGQNNLPPIGNHLKEILKLKSDPVWVEYQWCNNKDEICSVCGLRPIGPSKKAKDRKVCDVCEERRSDRAKEWAKKLNTTIWIDEVADDNGRIALIIGKFDLKYWLDGTHVRTLAVRKPDDNNGHTAEDVAKNPSFARLRRIWETTKRFWEEVEGIIKEKTTESKRYYFEVLNEPDLGYYHAYEMHVGKVKIPVLWDTDNKRLWIIDNPKYLSSEKQLNRKLEEVLKEHENKTITLYDPAGYGKKSKEAGKVQVSKLQEDNTQYSAYISILTEPQVFMAIVPANKAFQILKAIKTKYEREMGKVRNRLPLHLGVVFAPRMMPLRSILDAGRRMLNQKAKPVVWEVENIRTFGEPNNPNEMRGLRVLKICKREDLTEKSPNQFRMMHVISVKSPDNGKRFLWFVPALMGDGQTKDHWYPYVFLASPDEPTDRTRYYRTDLGSPWNSGHPWLVHAGELKPGDRIYFTPATFDFIFMDNNTRRFEIFYRSDGRRFGLPQRPYLLDELGLIEKCWNILKEKLSSNQQFFALVETIEKKRDEWFDRFEDSFHDEGFKEFCKATIKNVKWEISLSEADLKFLTKAAVFGYMRDTFELHHKILKENVVDSEDKSNQENHDSDD